MSSFISGGLGTTDFFSYYHEDMFMSLIFSILSIPSHLWYNGQAGSVSLRLDKQIR